MLASTSFTGGALGRRAPRPSLFGLDIGYFAPGADNFRPAMGFVVLAALVTCCLGVANLRRNQTGLRWLAVRSNERAAATVGIDVARAKLGAFAVSSFLAGLCGVFTAVTTTTLSMTSFPVIGSLVVVALVYLGGISSIGGALVAGLLAQGGLLGVLVSGSEAGDGSSVQAMSGVLLIAVAILTPDGLTGLARRVGRATLGPVLRTRFWALDIPSGRDIQCPERSSRSTGKTTTLLAISGLVPPLAGSVAVFGERQPGRHNRRNGGQRVVSGRVSAGLAHVPEDRGLSFDLTVREHLRLAAPARRTGAALAAATDLFPALGPFSTARPACCRAASSRCWRSPGPWRAGPACSSSTR